MDLAKDLAKYLATDRASAAITTATSRKPWYAPRLS
jgi:hypothetical protein